MIKCSSISPLTWFSFRCYNVLTLTPPGRVVIRIVLPLRTFSQCTTGQHACRPQNCQYHPAQHEDLSQKHYIVGRRVSSERVQSGQPYLGRVSSSALTSFCLKEPPVYLHVYSSIFTTSRTITRPFPITLRPPYPCSRRPLSSTA